MIALLEKVDVFGAELRSLVAPRQSLYLFESRHWVLNEQTIQALTGKFTLQGANKKFGH